MTPADPNLRILYAAWGFFECIAFGGLFYGWGSLVYILKDEGLYLDLCDFSTANLTTNSTFNPNVTSDPNPTSDPSTCPAQDEQLSLVFSVTSGLGSGGFALMGLVFSRFGTRVSRLLGFFLFALGTALLSLTTDSAPWLLYPGLLFMHTGGSILLFTNLMFAALFPHHGMTVVGLICAAFDSSAFVMQLVKIAYENSVSRRMSFLVIAVAHTTTLVSTFFFLPRGFISKQSPEDDKGMEKSLPAVEEKKFTDPGDKTEGFKGSCVDSQKSKISKVTPDQVTSSRSLSRGTGVENKGYDGVQSQDVNMVLEIQDPVSSSRERMSLWGCMKSSVYVLHVLWSSFLMLRFLFFMNSLNTHLEDLLDDDKDEVCTLSICHPSVYLDVYLDVYRSYV